MKKLTISVAVLLSSVAAKAQTEYVDISKKNIFGRSEMVVYNDDTNYNDLEYLYLGPFNNNWHYVKYTNASNIVVTMNDNEGDTREICTKQGDEELNCKVVDSFATMYKLQATERVFKVWISKTITK